MSKSHAFLIRTSKTVDEARTKAGVGNVAQSYSEIFAERNQSFEITKGRLDEEPTEGRGVYRFSGFESKEALIGDLQGAINGANWYEIKYHECDDPDADGYTPCSDWEVVASHGSPRKSI